MLLSDLLNNFTHTPTDDQLSFFKQFCLFMNDTNKATFVLKGYAGTGKSSLTQSIVLSLKKSNSTCVLMAPTGRAAKVIEGYASYPASTIHSHIYRLNQSQGGLVFKRKKNTFKNTLFIIDEASMLSDQTVGNTQENSLLEDIFAYVFQPKANNKLLLIGDEAQLPPVFLEESPALNADQLGFKYETLIYQSQLAQIMRQIQDSGILYNATTLRNALESYQKNIQLSISPDCMALKDRYEVENALTQAIINNSDESIIIVRSNKRANLYNEQIRQRILMRESTIEAGDKLMVLRNNYFWMQDNEAMSFIANGEMIRIERVLAQKELYGFQFAEVEVSFVDYPELGNLATVLLLDTLYIEQSALDYERRNELYQQVLEDFADEPSKAKKFKKLKENPYFNALEVKFAHAVTCHKAQGGQWDTVFIEQPYTTSIDDSYLRWLYTALTRAKKQVYLLGFKDDMIAERYE